MGIFYKGKFKHLVLNGVVGFFFFVNCSLCAKEKSFVKNEEMGFSMENSDNLILTNTNGNIAVDSWGKDTAKIEIRKVVYAHSESEAETLYDKIEIIIKKENYSIAITPRLSIEHAAVDLHIFLPRMIKINLKLENENGEIKVQGLKGDMEIFTSNGDIHCSKTTGEFKIYTDNGDIVLEDISGRISAISCNGDIQCAIETLYNNSISYFESTNGDIELTIPQSISPAIYVRSANGDINSDFPVFHSRKEFEDKNGIKISLKTNNGDVSIKRK